MKKFLTLRVPTLLVILVIALSLGIVAMKVGALIPGDKWDIGPWKVTSSNDLKPTGTTYDIGDATNRVAELNVDDIYIRKVASTPKVYVTVTNNSGASVSNGDVVCWNASTTVVMGVSVDTTETAANNYIAGVIAETIANGSNGLMQIWGYHSAIKCMEAGLNVTAGYDIITATRTGHGGGSATDNAGIGIWLDTKTSSGTAQGFLRGL